MLGSVLGRRVSDSLAAVTGHNSAYVLDPDVEQMLQVLHSFVSSHYCLRLEPLTPAPDAGARIH